jgi:arabinose-5-phosphate isomerase
MLLLFAFLKRRGFSSEDFARFHPGGSLGKKLYLRVGDFYLENRLPAVRLHDPLRKVIVEISSKRLGATAVIDEKGLLAGIITDGDLRRMLEKNVSIEKLLPEKSCQKIPKPLKEMHWPSMPLIP